MPAEPALVVAESAAGSGAGGGLSEPIRNPVFAGGTGRSGTTIVGRIMDNHPQFAVTRPIELRFLTDSGGLCDALVAPRRTYPPRPVAVSKFPVRRAARAGLRAVRIPFDVGPHRPEDRFAWLLVTRFYDWRAATGGKRGLQTETDLAEVEAAATDYRSAYRDNRVEASRGLVNRLADPMARRRGKPRWIDTTPASVRHAGAIFQIFPQAQMINMIRDGRDVASSMVSRWWGPDDFDHALRLWADLMLEGHRALRAAPPAQVLTLQLEDLIVRDREDSYRRLLDFLRAEDDPATRKWFDTESPASKAHAGRWREGLDASAAARIDEHYAAILADLTAAGVTCPT